MVRLKDSANYFCFGPRKRQASSGIQIPSMSEITSVVELLDAFHNWDKGAVQSIFALGLKVPMASSIEATSSSASEKEQWRWVLLLVISNLKSLDNLFQQFHVD